MVSKTPVKTEKAPAAIGPYNQAIIANGFIFLSGQIPITPEGRVVEGDIAVQTKQCLQNIRGVLLSTGVDIDAIVKVTVFLTDLNNFAAMNEVYAAFFKDQIPPARSTVQVAALPKGVPVEIEAVALAGKGF